jgi:hypothetical protein
MEGYTEAGSTRWLERLGLVPRHDGAERDPGGDRDPFFILIHGDRVPGAVLHTQGAADAAIQVYLDQFQ